MSQQVCPTSGRKGHVPVLVLSAINSRPAWLLACRQGELLVINHVPSRRPSDEVIAEVLPAHRALATSILSGWDCVAKSLHWF